MAPVAIAFGDPDNSALTVTEKTPLPVSISAGMSTADPVFGTFADDEVSDVFHAVPERIIWLTLSGQWSGLVKLQRSIDGVNWHHITLAGAPWGQFTQNICEPIFAESEAGAQYRLEVEVLSGEITFRISQ